MLKFTRQRIRDEQLELTRLLDRGSKVLRIQTQDCQTYLSAHFKVRALDQQAVDKCSYKLKGQFNS